MALVKMPDNGQSFELPDEVAGKDDILKDALRPIYPEIGNATITRSTVDGQLTVTVVKQAGRKGVNALVSAEPLVIDIEQIRTDGGTQTRAKLDMDVAEEYAEAIRAGAVFPPIEAMYDGASYWVTDGFHRLAAARRAGQEEIATVIYQGNRRDAILRAVGANQVHGLRRTNEDKRRAVTALLSDAEWARWSDRAIGEACGVAHTFVANVRRELSGNGHQMPQERTVQRGEQLYTFTPAAPQPKAGIEPEVVDASVGLTGALHGEPVDRDVDEDTDEQPLAKLEDDGDLAKVEPGESAIIERPDGHRYELVNSTSRTQTAEGHRVADAAPVSSAPTEPKPAPAPTPAPAVPASKPVSWPESSYSVYLTFRPADGMSGGRLVTASVVAEGLSPQIVVIRENDMVLPVQVRNAIDALQLKVTERFEGAK